LFTADVQSNAIHFHAYTQSCSPLINGLDVDDALRYAPVSVTL